MGALPGSLPARCPHPPFRPPLTNRPSPAQLSPAAGLPACPATPSISCSNAPVCNTVGASVQLTGACVSSDPAATLVYFANGQQATTTNCPSTGTLTVSVKPTFSANPTCPYNATFGFNLTGGLGPGGVCLVSGASVRARPLRTWCPQSCLNRTACLSSSLQSPRVRARCALPGKAHHHVLKPATLHVDRRGHDSAGDVRSERPHCQPDIHRCWHCGAVCGLPCPRFHCARVGEAPVPGTP